MHKGIHCVVMLSIFCVVHTAANLTNLQKIAYAIDNTDIERVKQVLNVLSDDEKTHLMHRKIAIIQQIGLGANKHNIRLNRTPQEQIDSIRSIGVFAWNIKLNVIEALLLKHAL